LAGALGSSTCRKTHLRPLLPAGLFFTFLFRRIFDFFFFFFFFFFFIFFFFFFFFSSISVYFLRCGWHSLIFSHIPPLSPLSPPAPLGLGAFPLFAQESAGEPRAAKERNASTLRLVPQDPSFPTPSHRPFAVLASTMDNLPYAVDADTSLTPAELNVRARPNRAGRLCHPAREPKGAAQTQNPVRPVTTHSLSTTLRGGFGVGHQKEGSKASIQTKFNYAWGLVKSTVREEQEEGCLYYLALGNYKLGLFSEARRFNDRLVEVEPQNAQAQSLKALINERVAKGKTGSNYFASCSSVRPSSLEFFFSAFFVDGFIGMAIVGGAVAVGALVIGMMRSKK
ncbi:MAG: hypothetical protein BJ554DRAFT_2777, partial [Olpidium bornovanus]